MPRLKALTSWAGRVAGEEFDASDSDARVLCALDLPGGPKAIAVDDRAMRAESAPEVPKQPSAPEAAPEKRRYMRRDLRAQN
jgi:hypothetical protein